MAKRLLCLFLLAIAEDVVDNGVRCQYRKIKNKAAVRNASLRASPEEKRSLAPPPQASDDKEKASMEETMKPLSQVYNDRTTGLMGCPLTASNPRAVQLQGAVGPKVLPASEGLREPSPGAAKGEPTTCTAEGQTPGVVGCSLTSCDKHQVEGELYSRQLAVAHDSWLCLLGAARGGETCGAPVVLLHFRSWKHWKRKQSLYVVVLFAKRTGHWTTKGLAESPGSNKRVLAAWQQLWASLVFPAHPFAKDPAVPAAQAASGDSSPIRRLQQGQRVLLPNGMVAFAMPVRHAAPALVAMIQAHSKTELFGSHT
eukprot:Skav235813  [mRNA]  locus=scaffold1267:359175:371348:- [translate_table: standard]